MKIIGILVCIFLLSAICLAEETEYFDWKGNKLFAARNYTDALVYYEKAISQEPGYIDAWIHKGDTQRALKDYNGSIASYNSALQIDGKKAAAWSGITEAYTSMLDYVNASIAANKTTALDNNKGNWLREGALFRARGMHAEASAKYDGALALDPKYREALYWKAATLMVLNKVSEAIPFLDRAIEVDPNYKQAYFAKGVALEANGKTAEAQQAYDNKADGLRRKSHPWTP